MREPIGKTPPLIHPRVRSAFREAVSDCGVVRQIERAFTDEGMDASEPNTSPEIGEWASASRVGCGTPLRWGRPGER